MSHFPNTKEEQSKRMEQKTQRKMDEWRTGLSKLEQSVNKLPVEMQQEYQKRFASLKLHWQQVESQFTALNRTNVEQREAAYAQWRDTAVSYNDAFVRTVNDMKKHVPLGWAEGFTNERTQDSVGWAEGFTNEGPEDSEGFAEGMGHKEKAESKGWAEGYDKVSQS